MLAVPSSSCRIRHIIQYGKLELMFRNLKIPHANLTEISICIFCSILKLNNKPIQIEVMDPFTLKERPRVQK